MEVSAEIRRSDLIKFNWYMLPRAKANRVMVLVVTGGVFVYLLIAKKPDDIASVLIALGASVVGGIGGLIGGFLFSLACIAFTLDVRSGVLGKHRYVLSEQGFHESTAANEGLQKWGAIQSISESRDYIFVRVNGYLFHLIPKRAFPSEEAAREFWTTLQDLWSRRRD